MIFHVLLWTLLPLLIHHDAPLDVIQGAVWGREWQLGYAKGPPLFAWILGVLDPLEDDVRLAAIYVVSQACIALTFLGVWHLGRRILPPTEALVAVMLMEGIYYFSVPTPELNEIILQMPISALLGWVFHRAIRDGRQQDWIIVGALAAIGMWTRYSTGTLLLSLGLFLLVPAERRHLRTAGPYIAVAVFLALWSPHLLWMVHSHFQSLSYVVGRASHLATPADYIVTPTKFALAQLLALLPALLLTLILRASRRPFAAQSDSKLFRADGLYIGVIALGPFLVAEGLSVVTRLGLRDMWGGPLWCFIGLYLVIVSRPLLSFRRLEAFTMAWCAVISLSVLAYVGVHALAPEFKGHERRNSFPGDDLADSITAQWHDSVQGKPLRYVVGEMWLAGNVAFYSPDRPSTFVNADPSLAPWIDARAMANAGAVLVWDAEAEGDGIPPALRQAFPAAVVRAPLVLAKRLILAHGTIRVGWAFLPPA